MLLMLQMLRRILTRTCTHSLCEWSHPASSSIKYCVHVNVFMWFAYWMECWMMSANGQSARESIKTDYAAAAGSCAHNLQDNLKSLNSDCIQCVCVFFHSIPFILPVLHFDVDSNGVKTIPHHTTPWECHCIRYSSVTNLSSTYQCARCVIKGFGCRSLFCVEPTQQWLDYVSHIRQKINVSFLYIFYPSLYSMLPHQMRCTYFCKRIAC